MDEKEIKKAFKKLTNLSFLLKDKNIIFGWGAEKGIPEDKIYLGRRGASRPDAILTPYDILKIVYTKPALFKDGTLTVVGVNGAALVSLPFKDKDNMKTADKFNECLALYKKLGLGK